MRTMKRTLSLLMLICMMLCMASKAFAEEPETLTCSFGSGGTKYEISGKTSAADPSNYTLKPANTSHSFPGPDAPVWSYLNQSHTGRRIYVESKRILMLFSNSDAANFPFVALQLHGLAAGTYDAAFSLDRNAAGGCARVYVVSLADYQKALSGYESLFLTQETAVSPAAQTKIFERLTDSALNDPEKAVVDCYSGAAATQSIGNITLPADGDYVLVFRCAGPSSLNTTTNCQFRLGGLSLTRKVASVTVGENITYYDTADAAVAAINATESGTVKLLANIASETAITLKSGVTLELNGKTLTATVDATRGTVTDATDGKGSIVGTSAVVAVGDNEVVLKQGNVCRIFDYELTVEDEPEEKDDGSVNFWFKAELDAAAYTMVSQGATGLTVGANMKWTPAEGAAASGTAVMAADKVAQWAGVAASGDYWFYVNVTGFDTLGDATGELKVTPTIGGNAGIPITYSVN